LNTSIDWPHEKGIHSLKMQPIIPDTNPTLILATTGNDSLFKTWSIIQDTSSALQGKNEWWNCEFIGKYRNLNCGPCSFSEDGSLLGIGFERSLTIWSTDNNELKLSLSHSKLDENIRY
jgi:NET1-associated nuclear protein 1 (U3 small nucleolar RNA-associated protein 17)